MLEFLKGLTKDSKNKQLDFTFLFTLIILLAIGLLALSSASSYYALTEYSNSSYYLIRQLVFAAVGIIVMLVISKIDYNKYKKFGYLIYLIGIFLMILVFVPGIGSAAKGARRWLNLGLFTFQPSEIMKLSLIIGMATYIIKNQKKMRKLERIYCSCLYDRTGMYFNVFPISFKWGSCYACNLCYNNLCKWI